MEDSSIEQVGFLGCGDTQELIMAGGEFCCNATRCAVKYYLNGPENIALKVNGRDYVNAGIDENNNIWCEIPLYYGDDAITILENDIYLIKMQGIVIVVMEENISKIYLQNKENIKNKTMKLIYKYGLTTNEAVGIMFLEKENKSLKVNPVVWVYSINTIFCETACGSGTVAIGMMKAYKTKIDQSIDVIQPSGYILNATVNIKEESIYRAIIWGPVYTDNITKYIL